MSAQEVEEEKLRLDKASKADNVEDLLKSLEALKKMQVTLIAIKESRIGKVVGKLRKHSNKDVSSASGDLVNEWKKLTEKKDKDGEKEKNSNEEREKEKEDSKKRKKGEKLSIFRHIF
eukprot:TRINITY_DN2884_c0_g1_i1.p3 TRINITY_DN2884_c0_g1~~TRINITY_DN2884_c0_g1_i1.p3  ORF type:complete len:118 (+),score=48.33 TRINITY_DN2884_c0_g1_i1:188-541(+)